MEVKFDPDREYKYEGIRETLKGKSILITGSTGFVGKVLLEKLLRLCPDIKTIYLLLRCSNSTAANRMTDFLDKSLPFRMLMADRPETFGKLVPIAGDAAVERLGISDEDFFGRVDEVSVVFHCAANVRFDGTARELLEINTNGVYHLMEMCKNLKNLEVIVHVSTAYSFCNKPLISEYVYTDEISASCLLEHLKEMNDSDLEDCCKRLMAGRPSLYHYSKALAEMLIVEKYSHMPVIIVRPSIITAAFDEPMPGWVDNLNGPSGFIALSSKGILKTLLIKKGVNADWVPVDLVVNTLLMAAYYQANERFLNPALKLQYSGIQVINCVSARTTTWSEVVDLCIPLLYKYPSESVYRLPGGVVTSCPIVHAFCKLILHYLPALILDCGCFLLGKQVRTIRSYNRIHGVLNHLQLYTTQEFLFEKENMYRLSTIQCADDRRDFTISQINFRWPTYLEDYVHGVRKFYLLEADETLPSARKRLIKLRLMWSLTKWLSTGVFVGFVAMRISKSNFYRNVSLRSVSTGFLQFFNRQLISQVSLKTLL